MGRRSKLTSEQWADVDKRILEGETYRSIARLHGISESALRERITKIGKIPAVREVAEKLAEAENSLAALPLSAQITARTLADRLKSISENLANAAHYGAATAHRLQALANAEVNKVDDADPLNAGGIRTLKGVGALAKLANESASIALNLLAANKDAVKRLNTGDELPSIIPIELVNPAELQ